MSGDITVERNGDKRRDMFRKYEVLIDGVAVGKLGRGSTSTFPVEPGVHVIQMKIDYATSEKITVTLTEGESVMLVTGPGGRPRFRDATRGRETYLWLAHAPADPPD